MTKTDKLISAFLIGFIVPVLFFMAFWFFSAVFFIDYVPHFSMFGLGVGMIIDILFLKKANTFFYESTRLPVILYLVYMAGIFGFFMGMPVFNILPGVFAGYYAGMISKKNGRNYADFKRALMKTNIFTSVTLLFFMTVSSIIALSDKYTGGNIQGMFKLNFEVTRLHIVLIIVIGGILLLFTQNLFSILLGSAVFKHNDGATGLVRNKAL